MTTPSVVPPGQPTPASSIAITVLGVGGAGGNAVDHLAARECAGMSFAVVNTDARALARCRVDHRVQIGAALTRGFSAGGDPDLGRQAAEEEADKLRALCQGAEIIFVMAGLGGGTGTGAAPVLARIAKESGALVLALVTLPFDCEGTRRQLQAAEGLQALKAAADGVICLPNQKVFAMLDENTPVQEAFRITNDMLAEGVTGIWRLLTAEGLIKIDFADLCRVVRGRHTASAFVTAEAQGPNRWREALDKILASPLLDGGQVLNQADDVLVSILGGPDLTMAEITRVMDEIRRHSEQAQFVLGAALEPGWTERLAITVVASERGGFTESPDAHPRGAEARRRPATEASELAAQLLPAEDAPRPRSRFVAPPPDLSPDKKEELLAQQSAGGPARGRRAPRMRQGQLPLEIISKGRFEKSEPTIYRGQDLDVPTYVRRGVALN